MSSPASSPDTRPHRGTTKLAFLTFGRKRKVACNTGNQPLPSIGAPMLHSLRQPPNDQPAMVTQPSSSTATGPVPNSNSNNNNNVFFQSPAAIPPRTSSTNSTPGAALRSVPETDLPSAPGHRRQRSRKA